MRLGGEEGGVGRGEGRGLVGAGLLSSRIDGVVA